jgi:hypothetical protein
VTTLRQIKNLAVPLLERHRDLALAGPMIVVKPVQHLLRFILIDQTGEADRPNPRWSLTDLFCRIDHIPVGLGELLYRRDAGSGQHSLWAWSDPTMPQAFVEVVESIALPKLRAIRTLADYRDFGLPKDPAHRRYYWGLRLSCELAIGNLDEVHRILIETPDAVTMLNRHRKGLGNRLLTLDSGFTADDRATIAGLLHEWEAYSVGRLKLGHVWEKAPFPIEQMAGPSL